MSIVNARSGQPKAAAFSAFYRERFTSATRLAWLLTSDPSQCEDVVQDAFARLHEHWDQVLDPNAYLRASIVNGCRDRARRRDREHRRLKRLSRDVAIDPTELVLVDAVAHLRYRQRAAIVLRYWGDLPDDEIAAALAVAPSTVRSLLARAMTQLRKEIER